MSRQEDKDNNDDHNENEEDSRTKGNMFWKSRIKDCQFWKFQNSFTIVSNLYGCIDAPIFMTIPQGHIFYNNDNNSDTTTTTLLTTK